MVGLLGGSFGMYFFVSEMCVLNLFLVCKKVVLMCGEMGCEFVRVVMVCVLCGWYGSCVMFGRRG